MFTSAVERTNHKSLMERNDELFRVRELSKYAIAYDVPEENFDQIAKLVTLIVNAPLGGISLVDSDFVWLKARIGVDSSCLEREGAFCAYAVDSNLDFFMVEDTKKDPRFAKSDLVTQNGVRFYAAAPLINKGYCLGTLWVMDVKPRLLEKNNILLMQGLASQICQVLDNHYQNTLTGFPNLSVFKMNLQAVINKQISRQSEALSDTFDASEGDGVETPPVITHYAFVFLKIHGVHSINRLFGREATEGMIKDFSFKLREWLGEDAFYAQINFSKFAFTLKIDNQTTLQRKTEEIQKFLTGLFNIADTQIRIVVSAGISSFPEHGVNVTALLEQAENAALDTGSSHYSSVRIHTLSDEEDIKILADLNRDIESHLESSNIVPYFQPQVNFLTGELVGFEALARWQHPEFGLIPAYRFIALAEKSGLIHKLDLRIFCDVCQALKVWIDADLDVVSVSTNFSRITLLHPGVMEEINRILSEYNIPRDKIEIEITESGQVEDSKILTEIAKRLHQMGLKVAIDDFGTGMSNLSSLQSFKFDRIKIDRQFIHNISTDPHIEGIFHFIKGISNVFGVELLCEGLDNYEDLEVLKRTGVGCVQGWIFGSALPKEHIPIVLERFNLSKSDRDLLSDNPSRISELFIIKPD